MSWKRYLGIGALCLGLAGSAIGKPKTEELEDKIYKEQERLQLVLEERRENKAKEVYDGLDEKTKELVDLTVEFIKEDGKRQVCEKVEGKDPEKLFYPFNNACDNKFEDVNKRLDDFIHGNNQEAFKEFFEKYVFFGFLSDENGGYILRYFGPKAGNKELSATIFDKNINMDFIKFIQIVDTAEEYSQGWKKDLTALQIIYKPELKDMNIDGTKRVYVTLRITEDEGVNFWKDCEIRKIRKLSGKKIDKAYLEVCSDIWGEAKQNELFDEDKNLAFVYAFVEKDMKEDGAYHEGSHFYSVNDKYGIDNETYAKLSILANNPSSYTILKLIDREMKIKKLFEDQGYNTKKLLKLSKKNPEKLKSIAKDLIYKN